MSSGRKTKLTENDENLCPLARKRIKEQQIVKLVINPGENTTEVFEDMGVGMLESDESSSSASAVVLAATACGSDENSNEATPNLDAPKLGGHQLLMDNRLLNISIESDTTEKNSSFVDPNETLKSHNSKVTNNNPSSHDFYYTVDGKVIAAKTHAIASTAKGRSPLAAVSYNNNYNNINQNTTSNATVSLAEVNAIKKQIFVPDENFFLYRNQMQQQIVGKDHFKRLSDEMILQVFKWLPKKTLIRCSTVCQRFNHLTRDESLWSRLDLGGKCLRAGALGQILSRGVVIMRLAQSEIKHPVFEEDFLTCYPDFQTKLQFLDLSMAVISKPSLKTLLSKCRQLKKLSLEHVKLSDEICDELAKNVHLETLNLAMCDGLEAWSIRKMMAELKNLNSLNISWTWLDVDAVSALVTNVTPNLMRLNVAGCRKTMFDSHLLTLSKRCTQLLELDLSDCTGLTSNAINIVCKFQILEYLSLSRCYGISASSYMELSKLPSLAYLDVFGILSDNALEMLENAFPSIGINKFMHSSVARPTVGSRRTSIWGLRTRD